MEQSCRAHAGRAPLTPTAGENEIRTLNSHTPGAFTLFLDAAKELERTIHERDFEGFAEIMQRSRRYYETGE